MLKAGEYSPNNPLTRNAEVPRDRDAFLGLGEYEHRANTLRRRRQREYREYLVEQARKKQEEKQLAERKRREQEEKELELERLQLERDNEILQRIKNPELKERDGYNNYGIRRTSDRDGCRKVDTGVQVNGWKEPSSVGVQTDESEFFHLSTKQDPSSYQTRAERELSPRTVMHAHTHTTAADERPINPAVSAIRVDQTESSTQLQPPDNQSHGQKRHYRYKPSILDADDIQMRNAKAEQEAAKRRQFYQQELKSQIEEQQRIREERQAREKMLEQAEMRRLEEQLRMLRAAQEQELWRHQLINTSIKDNTKEFLAKKSALQKDIETEQKSIYRASSQPTRNIYTSKSDTLHTKLPKFHSKIAENQPVIPKFTTDHTNFSKHYDVDNYLRKNLNPSKESWLSNRFSSAYSTANDNNNGTKSNDNNQNGDTKIANGKRYSFAPQFGTQIVETAQIHEAPSSPAKVKKYEPSFLRKDFRELIAKDKETDNPIPVLRHSPKAPINVEEAIQKLNSDAMLKVEDKWKVPAVQRNILKNSEGKNGSILTQLGSIRRQLQLEQLKLDKMLDKGSDVI